MTVYIAGPMKHKPFFNFPAFDRARDALLLAGHVPISPADMDRAVGFDETGYPTGSDTIPADFDMSAAMDRDIAAVRRCDAVLLIEGWWYSKGARAERALAEWCGKEIWYDIKPKGLTL